MSAVTLALLTSPTSLQNAQEGDYTPLRSIRQAREAKTKLEQLRTQVLQETELTLKQLRERSPIVEEEIFQSLKTIVKGSAKPSEAKALEKKLEDLNADISSVVTLLQHMNDLPHLINNEIPIPLPDDVRNALKYLWNRNDADAPFSADNLKRMDAVLLRDETPEKLIKQIEEIKPKYPHQSAMFSFGLSALCSDKYNEDSLYLGFSDGVIARASLTDNNSFDKLLPGHQYSVSFLLTDTIKGVKSLISSSRDKTVRIINTTTREVTHCLIEHSGIVSRVHYRSGILYTASYDGRVSFWHLQRSSRDGDIIKLDTPVTSSLFYSDNILLVGSREGSVYCYEFAEKNPCKKIHSWKCHKGTVTCLTSHSSNYVISGGEDCNIKVWDLTTVDQPELVSTLSGHTGTINDIVASEDCILFSASEDALIIIWDLVSGVLIKQLVGHYNSVTALALVKVTTSPEEEYQTKGLQAILLLPDEMFPKLSSPGTPIRAVTPTGDVSRWDTATEMSDGPTGSRIPTPKQKIRSTHTHYYLVSVSSDKTMLSWSLPALHI